MEVTHPACVNDQMGGGPGNIFALGILFHCHGGGGVFCIPSLFWGL